MGKARAHQRQGNPQGLPQEQQIPHQPPTEEVLVDEAAWHLLVDQVQSTVQAQEGLSNQVDVLGQKMDGLKQEMVDAVVKVVKEGRHHDTEAAQEMLRQVVEAMDPQELRQHMDSGRPVKQMASRLFDRPYLRHVHDAWPYVRDAGLVAVAGVLVWQWAHQEEQIPVDDLD